LVVAKFQKSLACLAIDRVGVVFSVDVMHNEEGFLIEGGINIIVSTPKDFVGFR
jgi:hypothetical protein